MNVYSSSLTLQNRDVDLFRRLRLSRLFELMQEASICHTEALGAGRAVTLDKGLLWVVTLQHCRISRLPEYDERITLETWPGETLHVLFPRQYRILDASGAPIISACAIWTLVDAATRRVAFPERVGVHIDGGSMPWDMPLPHALGTYSGENVREFTVPYSYVDLNGHMNNTRYFDLADDVLPAARAGRVPREISAEYREELRLDARVTLTWGGGDDELCLTGGVDKPAFRLRFLY